MRTKLPRRQIHPCQCHLLPFGSSVLKPIMALLWLARPTANSIVTTGIPSIKRNNR